MADVCGPFTLEDLDQFGSLDSLAFSLDSGVWETACIYDGSASTTATASVDASGVRQRTSSASIAASGATSLTAYRSRTSSASVSGSGAVSVDYYRKRSSSASVTTDSSVSALGGMSFSGIASLVSSSFAYARLYGALQSSSNVSASASTLCDGHIIGDNWSGTAVGANSWSNVAVGSNTWTTVSQGNNTWQPSV
jgi:hypothetical protein